MASLETILSGPPPRSLAEARAQFPERTRFHPSPADWRDEVLYFLLPDRFSDGQEAGRPLLRDAPAARTSWANRTGEAGWRWADWRRSGESRFQGGTINGVRSKLEYLQDLGVTSLWLGPVFRQRVEEDSYHGYGIQDFLTVDARFGTRADLVALVSEAHARGMRVILDIIFNHTGCNWLYDLAEAGDDFTPRYTAGQYQRLFPRSGLGGAIRDARQRLGNDDYVWPRELQDHLNYTRAGRGSLAAGDLRDPAAEHKRTDFESLRNLELARGETLDHLVEIYRYWIALTDCDGLRLDTLKHVSLEEGRNFCGAVKEFAETLGKENFLLLGEVAGGDDAQDLHLDIFGRNLDATLDIGQMRTTLTAVGQGLSDPAGFFEGFSFWDMGIGSHRNWGSRHVSVLDDHDHVFGPKVRFSADAPSDTQVIAPLAMQLFGLGIPCIYYGTEQALRSGPEPRERPWLGTVRRGDDDVPAFGAHDVFLRETMFGADHPRAAGFAGTQGSLDPDLPGFGPHGTAGAHVFDAGHPAYVRIRALSAVRTRLRSLRRGRQYRRKTAATDDGTFAFQGPGELLAWSRVLHQEEALVVVNLHGTEARGRRVEVDRRLRRPGSTVRVLCDTSRLGQGDALGGGAVLPVQALGDRRAFVDVGVLPASEVMVLI